MVPRRPVEVAVLLVVRGGAPVADRLLQHLLHRPVEAADLGVRQRVAPPVRVEPGEVEDFVRVDVADPGHEPLVHQQRLPLHPVPGQELREVLPGELALQGVEPQAAEFPDLAVLPHRRDEHLAERTGIDETELAPVGEVEHHVGVVLVAGAGSALEELARHPEVDDQSKVVIGIEVED